jgi:hypothetical protein
MKRTRWIVAAMTVLVLGLYWVFSAPNPIRFPTVTEASVNLTAAGFHCTADRADGVVTCGFMVTQEESTWKVANNLCKIGKMGSEWNGKVWVTYTNDSGTLCTIPDDATTRSWGGVLAYGDARLLDQIEETLRRTM